jgi:hypothetical protein
MRWLAGVVVASLFVAGSVRAESAPASNEESDRRTWTVGLRASFGFASATRAHLCLLSRSDACDDDHASYGVFGGEVYAALGRPTSYWRWKPSLEVDFGAGVAAIRALSSAQLLSDPTGSGGLLLEMGGGFAYDHFDRGDASSPMIALAAALGGRYNGVEILARGEVDALIFTSMAVASVRVGYAF